MITTVDNLLQYLNTKTLSQASNLFFLIDFNASNEASFGLLHSFLLQNDKILAQNNIKIVVFSDNQGVCDKISTLHEQTSHQNVYFNPQQATPFNFKIQRMNFNQ